MTTGCWSGQARRRFTPLLGRGREAQPLERRPQRHDLSARAPARAGRAHDFVLVLARDGPEPSRRTRASAWSATEAAWRDRVPDLDSMSGATRRATRLRGPHGADQRRRRDGRCRDDVLARAGPPGPQLRLPLRLDPRPMLRGSGGRQGRGLPAARRCRPLRARASARGRPGAEARLYGHRRPSTRPATTLDLPGYPGGDRCRRQLGQHAVPARRLRRSAPALRRRRRSTITSTPTAGAPPRPRSRRSRARWHEKDAGIWELDPDDWTHSRLICAAGLRAISSCGRGGEQAAAWLALADAIAADTCGARHSTPSGAGSAPPQTNGSTLRCFCRRSAGRSTRDDPRSLATLQAVERELTDDGYVYRYRPDETAARRGRRRLPALRLPALARPRPTRQRRRSGPPLRAQPGSLWAGGPALRRVRRNPATAAGQPAAGLRSRVAARMRERAARAVGRRRLSRCEL